MMKSDASWSQRPRIVGDLERPDHWFITKDDSCTFFGEYTPGGGWSHSATNQLILNLKKKPSVRGTYQWQHKLDAIRDAGLLVRGAVAQNGRATFVPIAPSKTRANPEFDDRMAKVAKASAADADVREILTCLSDREPRHANGARRDLDELKLNVGIDASRVGASPPSQVVLLDDMLTTGCSFRVSKERVQEVWPGVPVYGLFISRRVPDRVTLDFDFETLV